MNVPEDFEIFYKLKRFEDELRKVDPEHPLLKEFDMSDEPELDEIEKRLLEIKESTIRQIQVKKEMRDMLSQVSDNDKKEKVKDVEG